MSKGLVFEELQPLVSTPEGRETKTKLYHRVRRLGEQMSDIYRYLRMIKI